MDKHTNGGMQKFDMNFYDILIAGAGVSGSAAAVAAARCGKSVLLVERDYYPGGTATSALVNPMQTFHSPSGRVIGGFAQELVEALVAAGGSLGHLPDPLGFVTTVTPVDAEILKIVLTDFLKREGVNLIMGVRLIAVKFAGDGIIGSVVLQGEGGEEWEVGARVFIDATGNGDLTYAAGVPMEIDKDSQPMTLIFRVGNVDAAEIINFQEFEKLGSIEQARSAGKIRAEGKNYVMQDGDIALFKFNV